MDLITYANGTDLFTSIDWCWTDLGRVQEHDGGRGLGLYMPSEALDTSWYSCISG